MTSLFLSFRKTLFYPLFVFFFFVNVSMSIFFAIGLWGKLHIYTNISESMYPTIELGDLALIKKQNMNSYKKGDIVSFYTNRFGKQEVITHRIDHLGGNVYITKGDNNSFADSEPLLPRLIIGKVIAIIPYIGYWVMAVNSAFGKLVFIILPMYIIVSTEMMKIKKDSN